MRKTILFLFLISAVLVSPLFSRAQSVAINADSSLPDPSAILDLKSGKKGFLVPRMTKSQRDAIATPATGLLIYQTDNTPGFYWYSATGWGPLITGGGTSTGTGDNWSITGNNIANSNTGNVGIGTTQATAKFEVKTPINATGLLHLGVTDSTGTDSVLLGDYIRAGVPGRPEANPIPPTASFGTFTQTPLQLHAGTTGWLNVIPDGSVVIGDSIGSPGLFCSPPPAFFPDQH